MKDIKDFERPYLILIEQLVFLLTKKDLTFQEISTAIGLAWQIKQRIEIKLPEWKAPDE